MGVSKGCWAKVKIEALTGNMMEFQLGNNYSRKCLISLSLRFSSVSENILFKVVRFDEGMHAHAPVQGQHVVRAQRPGAMFMTRN